MVSKCERFYNMPKKFMQTLLVYGLITPSLDEMVHVATEIQLQKYYHY